MRSATESFNHPLAVCAEPDDEASTRRSDMRAAALRSRSTHFVPPQYKKQAQHLVYELFSGSSDDKCLIENRRTRGASSQQTLKYNKCSAGDAVLR
jgi:hypothetical protein